MNLFSKKKNNKLRINMPTYDGSNSYKCIQKELVNDFKASLTINNHNDGIKHNVWFIIKPENYIEKHDINELTDFLDFFPWV